MDRCVLLTSTPECVVSPHRAITRSLESKLQLRNHTIKGFYSMFLGIKLRTKPFLFGGMAWCLTGHRSSPEPVLTQMSDAICHLCYQVTINFHNLAYSLFYLNMSTGNCSDFQTSEKFS